MFQHFLHTLTLFFLQKSVFLRTLYLLLFLMCCFVALSYFGFEEWISAQYKQANATTTQSEILKLFEKHALKTQCAKIFCTNKELEERKLSMPHTNHVYGLLFTCKNQACYEFIRELEMLPLVFLHKVASSNVTILQDLSQKEEAKKIDSNLQGLEDAEQTSIQWRQDMFLIFSVEEAL